MGKGPKEPKKDDKKDAKGGKKGGKVDPKAVPAEKGVDAQEVRHILVEKHSKAAEILNDINMGKITFNEAARTHSIDKAGRSGLIGWKRKGELDPDFWEASLLVDEGDYTKEPVKTQWGYHIIMVQSRK